jgi:hypothetical protein
MTAMSGEYALSPSFSFNPFVWFFICPEMDTQRKRTAKTMASGQTNTNWLLETHV